MNINEYSTSAAQLQTQQDTTAVLDQDRVVLRMKRNTRMGGSVPVWEKASAATQAGAKGDIENNFNTALYESSHNGHVNQALSYAPGTHPVYENAQPFGFGDLIDMVNPLQHIPLVGHVYREITGDEIRDSSKIIGGAVFGGGAGAAMGLADTIMREETGKDSAGAALSMIRGESVLEGNKAKKSYYSYQEDERSAGMRRYNRQEATGSSSTYSAQQPIQQDTDTLPASMLQFTNQSTAKTLQNTEQRWTNTVKGHTNVGGPSHFHREPVTEISMAPMPERTRFNLND